MKCTMLTRACIIVAASCQAGPPTTTDQSDTLGVSASLGICYGITGVIRQAGNSPLLTGTIVGNIEGNVVTHLASSAGTESGSADGARQTWYITGGVVEALIGETIHLSLGGETAYRRPNSTHSFIPVTVTDGVQKGQLTYSSAFDGSQLPLVLSAGYQGVICP